MIRLFQEQDLTHSYVQDMNSPLLLKIVTNYLAYENKYAFNNVYVMLGGEEVLGYFLYHGETICLHITKPCGFQEIQQLLFCFSYHTLWVEKDMIEGEIPQHSSFLDLMCLFCKESQISLLEDCEILENDSLENTYAVFSSNGTEVDYEQFYLDTNHKIRHGLATVYNLYENNQVVATLGHYGKWKQIRLIEGLEVNKGYCGKGYGLFLLQNTLVSQETYFLLCEKQVTPFYEKTGFVKRAEVLILTREQ